MLPPFTFNSLKVRGYRYFGYELSTNVKIAASAIIMGNIKVRIGDGSFIGHETLITGGDSAISIGKNCDISSRVSIVSGTHQVNPSGMRVAGKGIGRDVVIGDGVWIGFGAMILPGVSVGNMSIVAAGSVVTKDVPSYTMVGGNPARILKSLRPGDE